MTRLRWPVMVGIGGASLLLAFLLRDVVYQLVIVPLAYLLWLLQLYYALIPQWVLWSLLLVLLFLVVLWNLLPESRPSARTKSRHGQLKGGVEELALWIRKARRGNYFKWQLANRLGKIARRLNDMSGPRGRQPSSSEAVEKYLDAGLNHSFVDFLGPRSPFERPPRTPLDIDPKGVADYLESQMENTSDRRG
jgi:hypothetical protein